MAFSACRYGSCCRLALRWSQRRSRSRTGLKSQEPGNSRDRLERKGGLGAGGPARWSNCLPYGCGSASPGLHRAGSGNLGGSCCFRGRMQNGWVAACLGRAAWLSELVGFSRAVRSMTCMLRLFSARAPRCTGRDTKPVPVNRRPSASIRFGVGGDRLPALRAQGYSTAIT